MPRPTRTRSVRAPSAGLRVFMRMLDYSSTRTGYWTLLIRPRTCGLSFSSRTSLTLRRPSALTDRRWRPWVPCRPLTRRTLTVPPVDSFLAMEDLLDLLAALGRDLARRMHLLKALDGGAHQVDRVARAGGLGQHVLHANRLEHGAHRAAGDHAGTFGSRLHEHLRGAVVGLDGVPQGAAAELDVAHALAGRFHRLLDRGRHFTRLAVAEADTAFAIAHHGERGEGELAAALHGLRDAVDRDQLPDQIGRA